MSYDVSLNVHVNDGPCVFDRNMTSNVAPMWREAGIDLRLAKGALAGALVYRLNEAIQAMKTDQEKYLAMQPDNGWGDYNGALQFLVDLRDACVHFPTMTVQVSH